MTWDGDADQQLLLSILATHAIKVDFDAIAARVGPQCTPRAAQERIKKLKKMAKDRGFVVSGAATVSTGTTTAAGTPKKRKTTTGAKGAKNGSRAKKGEQVANPGEVDDEDGRIAVKGEKGEEPEAGDDEAIRVKSENGVKRDWDEFAEAAENGELELDGSGGEEEAV
ncbi:MAG: hypothetical protein M1836_003053 [Candelina mexicana]|nr:MAG: hypothetical protein M1836_003053 [Candelina mexicana]